MCTWLWVKPARLQSRAQVMEPRVPAHTQTISVDPTISGRNQMGWDDIKQYLLC